MEVKLGNSNRFQQSGITFFGSSRYKEFHFVHELKQVDQLRSYEEVHITKSCLQKSGD
ncbi:hypothetical protein HPP92_028404 [Vanilla planifolia]|uniref:Uncharacterized protein n=1 Tax=Vanilla planifolia TaxID=51239 RepID=A0A835U3R1_VANPL|nr:hypothetical protein HPP92_028404 [Vanilla planifolia]